MNRLDSARAEVVQTRYSPYVISLSKCSEWQRQLYINFVDFQKAFDSVHRDSLWRILRTYAVPQKIVQLIQSFYKAFTCNVENSDVIVEVKAGVRRGRGVCCLHSY